MSTQLDPNATPDPTVTDTPTAKPDDAPAFDETRHIAVTVNGNPFAETFPQVVFDLESRNRTYGDAASSVSRRLVNVSCLTAGGYGAVTGSVYARMERGSKAPILEFSFTGNRGVQALIPLGSEGRAYLAEWKKALCRAAYTWYKDAIKSTGGIQRDTITAEDLGNLFG